MLNRAIEFLSGDLAIVVSIQPSDEIGTGGPLTCSSTRGGLHSWIASSGALQGLAGIGTRRSLHIDFGTGGTGFRDAATYTANVIVDPHDVPLRTTALRYPGGIATLEVTPLCTGAMDVHERLVAGSPVLHETESSPESDVDPGRCPGKAAVGRAGQ